MNYVVGFVTDPEKRYVLLMRKSRPEWQAGRLNGVGGKIKPLGPCHCGVLAHDHYERWESPVEAMVREFREETGVSTGKESWKFRFQLLPNDCRYLGSVTFFRGVSTEVQLNELHGRETGDGEHLEVHLLNGADWSRLRVVPNLRWALPLALDDTVVSARITDVWNRNSDDTQNEDEVRR